MSFGFTTFFLESTNGTIFFNFFSSIGSKLEIFFPGIVESGSKCQ